MNFFFRSDLTDALIFNDDIFLFNFYVRVLS